MLLLPTMVAYILIYKSVNIVGFPWIQQTQLKQIKKNGKNNCDLWSSAKRCELHICDTKSWQNISDLLLQSQYCIALSHLERESNQRPSA